MKKPKKQPTLKISGTAAHWFARYRDEVRKRVAIEKDFNKRLLAHESELIAEKEKTAAATLTASIR